MSARSLQTGTWMLTRRVFIGDAAAATAAVVLLPVPAIAAPPQVPRCDLLADWTIDDMWGVYPRYADAIDFGRPARDGDVAVDPVDAQFVA